MTNYRLFPSTNGPSTAASYSGSFQPAVVFGLTGVSWFEGYWWWVCPSGGQPTAPQKFALWHMAGNGQGTLLPASVVTSGTLATGWNYVKLPTPIPLSVSNDTTAGKKSGDGAAVYIATTAFTGPFPINTGPGTGGQFGAGEAYSNGILEGPLLAYSDLTGTAITPAIGVSLMQGEFGTANSDPTTSPPSNNSSNSSNFWMDVQVSDTAPAGYSGSYRLFPNFPLITSNVNPLDTAEQTMGTQFSLSKSCALDKVWFYSPSGVGVGALPTSTMIWDLGTKEVVAGTQLAASWSGAVGGGWVSNSYATANVTLPAGDYIASVYYVGGSTFYLENRGYFGDNYGGAHGPAPSGLTSGPLSSPGQAAAIAATGFGNTCYIVNSDHSLPTGPAFPSDSDNGDDGENRWVDVEVTPAGSTTPPPAKSSGVPLTFFP